MQPLVAPPFQNAPGVELRAGDGWRGARGTPKLDRTPNSTRECSAALDEPSSTLSNADRCCGQCARLHAVRHIGELPALKIWVVYENRRAYHST